MDNDVGQFKKELKLVNDALGSEVMEEKIIKYLTPLVKRVAQEFIDDYQRQKNLKLTGQEKALATKAGWAHLHLALRKYAETAIDMAEGRKKPYTFSAYFTWFVKQGVSEYLQFQYLSKT